MITQRAVDYILRVEGGYVDDPNDPGGATNFGITQKVYDTWIREQNLALRPVRQIDMDEVRLIYDTRYWTPGWCGHLPWPLDLAHFDACVNLGEPEDGFKRSVKLLQRAINQTYANVHNGLVVDGQLGRRTIYAAQHATRGPRSIFDNYLWFRVEYYVDLRSSHHLRGFIPTWMWRVLQLRKVGYESP